ncbi:MAG: hypothetical protein DRJ44_02875 [Thermoprotei archaeon]|nr:MAG: hypothetical protein DRJ44_02875 [Thermoprotei archaeon]
MLTGIQNTGNTSMLERGQHFYILRRLMLILLLLPLLLNEIRYGLIENKWDKLANMSKRKESVENI